jgi:hypothetical protein
LGSLEKEEEPASGFGVAAAIALPSDAEVEEEDTKAGVSDEALGEKRAERRWTWGREKGYLMRE